MILFDIDNFKYVNDTFGHQIGDEVLKEISRLLTNSIRETDISVRWGGEEFLILLPQTDLFGAQAVAEKLRINIRNEVITQKQLNITASFGVTQMKETDDENLFVSRCDKLLYKAKNNGKNIVVAEE